MTDYAAQADVLDDAADLIERAGWWNPHKGIGQAASMGGENFCANTALYEVAPMLWGQARDRLAVSLGLDGTLLSSVPSWNNSQDNPQPVLDGMRKCAKELRVLADEAGL